MAIIRKSEYYAKKREYYQKNKQAMLVYQHEYQRKRRFEWHEGIKSTPEIQRRAEELADNILGAHGFVDVQRMSYTFSFDYLARKDGGLLAIEVTTSRTKRFLKRIHSRHPDTRKDFTSFRLGPN